MTTTNVNELFTFDNISVNDTEHAAVIMYSKFTKASAATKASMAAFVHRFGVELQSKYEISELSTMKISIAREFNKTWDAELKWITSDEAGDDQLNDQQIKSLDAARRKIGNTIGYGGRLTVLETASQCEKFNKDEKAKKDGINLARELREEGEAVALGEGLEEGTDKFKEFVDKYVKDNTPESVDGGKDELSPMMVFSQKLGTQLEKLEKSGINDKELNDFMSKLEILINNKIDACVQDAALDSELVQKSA